MSQATAIEWTDLTWNPVSGCSKVSPGCGHCYAEEFRRRYNRDEKPWTPANAAENVILKPHKLREPLSKAKQWQGLGDAARAAGKTDGKLVFVNSMSDLFHERLTGLPAIRRKSDGSFETVDDSQQPRLDGEPPRPDFIADVFAVMSIATRHTFQVLTKRPEAMQLLLSHANFWLQVNGGRLARGYSVLPGGMSEFASGKRALPNVWLGTSIENRHFSHRARTLRMTPAAVRFISAEPLLGPLDGLAVELAPEGPRTPPPHDNVDDALAWERGEHYRPKLPGIDWLIVGGESGPKHRPIREEWVRDLRDAAHAAGTAFFFKQWGGRTPKTGGRLLDGRTWDEFPAGAAVRS